MIKLISYKSIIKYNGRTIDEINNYIITERRHYGRLITTPTHVREPLAKLKKEYEARKLTLLHTDTDAIIFQENKNE